MLKNFLKRTSGMDILISIIFILFGIVLIINPQAIISIISFVLGAMFILIGILKIINYFADGNRVSYHLAMGITAIILGIVVMFATDFILSAFRIIIGLWIIYSGIMNLQTTIIWKEYTSKVWISSCILSVILILAGFYVLICSGSIFNIIGAIIVFYGIINIVQNAMFMKYVNKQD